MIYLLEGAGPTGLQKEGHCHTHKRRRERQQRIVGNNSTPPPLSSLVEIGNLHFSLKFQT